MIKIQNGKMVITCDSVAEAAELLRLQTGEEKGVSMRKGSFKAKSSKKFFKTQKWTKTEVKAMLDAISKGTSGKDIIKNEFLNERHTEDGIQFLYYKLKKGASVSGAIEELLQEIKKDSPNKSILDAGKKPGVKEYLILD